MPSEAPPKHPMPSEARRFAVPAAFRHSRNSPSFPRRRESGPFGFGFSDRFLPRWGSWIPAFAGMTKSGRNGGGGGFGRIGGIGGNGGLKPTLQPALRLPVPAEGVGGVSDGIAGSAAALSEAAGGEPSDFI
ncbi:hypothetical protein [Neisseria polysaccharea]|uniref:hypothetical protein n=1 Tax=Neisseria polysaccharea TaxID=489 RepID=UPI0027E056FE|nr:hypothetical protein [Neisseria polysaccharea]